jgi:hypothetical protein
MGVGVGIHFPPGGGKMKNGGADTRVLESDDGSYVKFDRLLAKARSEGRVDGKYRCPMCGMRYHTVPDAMNCCAVVAQSA